jgi:predicted Holliday junction resolvase-like endonuclease
MDALIQAIDSVQELLAICPCCYEIFRLVEGKFIFPQTRPRSSEYLELVTLESRVDAEEDCLYSAEARFNEGLDKQRRELREMGRRLAKIKLRKIDPIFSARDIDPQDVKAIFHPVEYIIFHGLHSDEGVDFLEFVSRSPESKTQEAIVESIDMTVRNGDIEFETLYMRDDGSFAVRKACERSR